MARMQAPDKPGVRIRMYNPGFGDCFLLAFKPKGPRRRPVYVLIDCGVHGGFKGGSDQIREVIADIREACGGTIDLCVVSHEHADHVSGFYLGRHLFAGTDKRGQPDPKGGITVKEVWFGWTENPRSRKAQRLDKVKKLLLQGLYATPQAMSEGEDGSVSSMLGFYAIEGKPKSGAGLPLGGEVLGVSTRDARDELRRHAEKSTYLKPKRAPLAIPGVAGIRVFVLGPPEDERFLLKPDPTGAAGEVFEGEEDGHGHALRFGMEEALVAALGARGGLPAAAGRPPSADRYQPFSGNHRRHIDKIRQRPDLYPFFHQRYGFDDERSAAGEAEAGAGAGAEGEAPVEGKSSGAPADGGGDFRPNAAWRRIDEEWRDGADSMALKLDSATNNSSLVLAFELEGSKRVLLFPGDAQVGNWKSWHIGGWSHKNGLEPGEEITAEDLLNRTVLYKVGHHGSHNATLKEQGLDMMTSEELMALIPVDEEWARARRPHSWKMPFGPMYEDLMTRTRGRIVRTDHGVVGPKGNSRKAKAERAEIAEAWKVFPGQITKEAKLYTELVIEDDQASP